MKIFKLFVLFVAILTIPQLSTAKTLSKDQLLEMGGKTLTGIVTKVGVYNFFVKTPGGEELNILTEQSTTQFSPEDERLMVGDEISVVYLAHESASLSVDKLVAEYIEFTNKVPRAFLTGELKCVVSLSKRNENACYLPDYGKSVVFEGRWPETKKKAMGGIREYDNSPGSKLLVKLEAIPAKIGNGYVYIIRGARKLEP